MATEHAPYKVLFVCLGNICRSPTAHAVLERKLASSPLAGHVHVDSAGTGDWHIGHAPDVRAALAARQRGYHMDHLRARQVRVADFREFDWILAMDHSNLADLKKLQPEHAKAQLSLFLPLDRKLGLAEVPDPYYGGPEGFETVLDLVEAASDALIRRIQEQL